eukprot:TRINITY_DN4359_c0_g1_i3.p1 TRINITY_DN4359_c0_g1~~TRINITY_DN4359_c0_g1_i3.p1  ORF type:complete len:550 (-),score=101.77 TRINITY_DN4359_c0_g1_i3:652-2259(-)
MAQIDRERVNAIVLEASRNSRFYAREQQKDAETAKRVAALRLRAAELATIPPSLAREADALVESLEMERVLTSQFVVVDLDQFYAAVEIRDNPTLKGLPVAVGDSHMISTSSYEARAFGVRSAMPGFIGKKLCPQLVFVKPHFERYRQASAQVREVLLEYDPHLQMMSMDEAYMDLTAFCAAQPERDVAEIVAEMRARIFEKTQLTASAGIAANKMLSKICSDINKPNGQFFLPRTKEAITEFMRELPIRKVPGVGKVQERLLVEGLGISTCGDLLQRRSHVVKLFSPLTASFLLRSALGIGSTTLDHEARKSISHERTFSNLSHPDALRDKLHVLCSALSEEMQEKSLLGRVVSIKLKLTSFELRSRSVSLPRPTCQLDEIYAAAKQLLEGEFPIELRLMGVRMSNLTEVGASAEPQDPVPSAGSRSIFHYFGPAQARAAEPTFFDLASDSDSHDTGQDCIMLSDSDSDSAEKPATLQCPVCWATFSDQPRLEFHVDQCLAARSRSANPTKQQALAPKAPIFKKPRLHAAAQRR